MAVTIQNQYLSATVNEHGAELASLIAKKTGIDYMWSADAKYWGRRSPVLFPIEGRLKDDQYVWQDKTYHLTQHGFARDCDFEVVTKQSDYVSFELKPNSKTKENYPFDFILRLNYSLIADSLELEYEVINPSDSELHFALGAHPAFKVPLIEGQAYEDYYIEILPNKARKVIPLSGGLTDPKNAYLTKGDVLKISHETFKDDAIIYDLEQEETTFVLKNNKDDHGIALKAKDAKFTGIWSCYPAKGQFVCIEPWWGLADTVQASGKLEEKFANNVLAGHETFKTSFSVRIF